MFTRFIFADLIKMQLYKLHFFMAIQDLKYKELTEKIIGCAMKVHRHFGLGFPEIVYKRALIIELEKVGLKLKQEIEKDIIYDDQLIYKEDSI